MKLEQVAIALDQLLGAVFMNCMADETMSAKLWRCREQKRVYKVMQRTLDWVAWKVFGQRDHCMQSFISEINRKQLPNDYR